ncbi:metal ABC transporter solute-binding protein, Zn/Mn family [Methylohalomonas lacus]|nr:zinc ABC transporter substrate-binding protein [Methylohalomonas lacus]
MRGGLLLLGCLLWLSPLPASERLSLFVSIPPQAWLLEQLGGERFTVRTMLGPNANPHNYDPAARQLVALADAHAYFTIGIPFESMWQQRLAAINADMTFIHCGADTHEHDHHDHDAKAHSDPHIWTSPLEASAIAACMVRALTRIDPDGKEVYADNLTQLQQRLADLDQRIRALLADNNNSVMLVQHPAWDYFAANYDLEQLAIEQDGHEPNARHLVRVIERGRELDLKTVFTQSQYGQAAARLVADAIDARIVEADPMAYDYPASLIGLARSLAGDAE